MPYPTLSSNSTRLQEREPAGPGSLWYDDGLGHRCIYAGSGPAPCFTVVPPGGQRVDPAQLAASAVAQADFGAGAITTSPTRHGTTGADSWFWLEPGPTRQEVSASRGGERVTVTAEPESVVWRFGDGEVVTGGPGVRYRPDASADGAIRHAYQTRCLPGDRGRNPYVAESCGEEGYEVIASVQWRVTYRASGPVDAAGSLPGQSTQTSIVYAVGEARAFLTGDGS